MENSSLSLEVLQFELSVVGGAAAAAASRGQQYASRRSRLLVSVYESLDRLADAEAILLEEAEGEDGRRGLAFLQLGDMYSRKNKTVEAIAFTERAMEEAGNSSAFAGKGVAVLHKRLGGLYVHVDVSLAVRHFDSAVELGLFDADIRRFYASAEYRATLPAFGLGPDASSTTAAAEPSTDPSLSSDSLSPVLRGFGVDSSRRWISRPLPPPVAAAGEAEPRGMRMRGMSASGLMSDTVLGEAFASDNRCVAQDSHTI